MVGANSTHTTVTDINEQLLPDYYHMVLPAFLCVCVYVRLQYSSRNISTQLNWLNNVEMWEMGIPLSAKAAFCVSKQLCYIVTDPDLISKSKLAYLNLLFNLSHKSEFTVKTALLLNWIWKHIIRTTKLQFVPLTTGEQAVHLSKARLAGRTLSNLERKPRICGEVNTSKNLSDIKQKSRIKH